MRLKIALCKSILAGPASGADESLVTYAVALHEAGHDVTVALLYPPSHEDQYYRRLARAGVRVECVVETSALYSVLRVARDAFFSLVLLVSLVPRSFDSLRGVWQFVHRAASKLYVRRCRRFFRELRPDLLHVFTPDAGAVVMIRAGHAAGIPVLYHELGTPHYLPALDGYYRQLAEALPLCAEFAALSPRLAGQWAAKYPFLKHVSVLPLISEDCGARDAAAPSPFARPAETVFGFAARIERGKGPLLLLDAMAELNRAGCASLVRLAGTGEQLHEAKARARALGLNGACEFTGFYTEPAGRTAFMRTLDVFVLPSFAEGTPNSVIEAMAHGLPVVASDVGGLADLVTPDCGLLVPAGDSAALADAMRRLARDPALRASMGRAARERYLKLFPAGAVLPLIESAYVRVAGTRTHEATHAGAGPHPWNLAAEC
jgi:glycosyltransferase involved in cell wall biosynthesis